MDSDILAIVVQNSQLPFKGLFMAPSNVTTIQ